MNEIEDSFEDLINKILDLNISDIKKNKLIDRTYDILSKVTDIVDSQSRLEERVSELEEYIYKERVLEDINSVICPYCNKKIEVKMDLDSDDMDMVCPFCKNEVHLQWSCDEE